MEYVCVRKCYWGPRLGTETLWEAGDRYFSQTDDEKVPEYFEPVGGAPEPAPAPAPDPEPEKSPETGKKTSRQ